jgi:DNA-binding protein HU-beta
VNKQELVASIAEKAGMTKTDAARALDATVAAVTEALRQNETVTLVGFGSFYVGERAARTGRNPRTGKNIKIKAAKVPKFRAGKGLKDSVN